MGSVFKFKQFEVDQNGCAMKINTDGVILGAIADQRDPLYILDIGTGTGVIAMMLAQRFKKAKVDAVEIDGIAAATAARNMCHTFFAGRMEVYPLAFEYFQPAVKYDIIVSNPPYFVNDLKNPELKKQIARHTHEDFFDMLLRHAASMLNPDGRIWLILPVKQAEKVRTNAVLYKLYTVKLIHIYSDSSKPAFRQIICLGLKTDLSLAERKLTEEHLYIYEEKGKYTAQYRALLKDFFLAF